MSLDLSPLNPEQLEAVTTTGKPLLLLAGAGSGKTRVITYRIAYLIQNKAVPPQWILALTFTNKAAGEMAERVKELLGAQGKGVLVTTFHSLCVRILREYIPILGFEKDFVIFDTTAQLQCMKSVMEEQGLDATTANVKSAFYEMMRFKGEGKSPNDLEAQRANPHMVLLGRLLREYNKLLKSCNALDFDDILFFALELIQKHPEKIAEVQDRWHYLLVDEYQDTNRVQYKIVSFLAAKRRRLCVVGDDDQSIYGWRGADLRNILDFEKDFPEAAVIRLEQNYRSTQTVLRAANSVIQNNSERMPKSLWTHDDSGPKVRWVHQPNEREELEEVVRRLREYKLKEGRNWADFAFLYRSNHQSRAIEEVLRDESVPYQLVGGVRFFDRKEIQDCLAYMRFLHNPADDISLFRILNYPRRGLGQSAIAALGQAKMGTGMCFFEVMEQAASLTDLSPRALASLESFVGLIHEFLEKKEEVPFWRLFADLFERLDIKGEIEKAEKQEEVRERKINNYLELINTLFLYGERKENSTLADFLEYVSLFTEQDGLDEKAEKVSLMTIHAAKGLEFEYVSLVGLTDGQFPHQNAVLEGRVEEERRLFYVALTRAKKALVLSMAATRSYYGERLMNQPSRFIEEIDPDCFEIPPFTEATAIQKAAAAQNARASFFERFKSLKTE